jgi:hypothetical protein
MKHLPKLTQEECFATYMAVKKAGYSAEITDAICNKLIANISFTRPGRPKKPAGQDDDVLRAKIADHYAEMYPELTDAEHIETARLMADTMDQFRTVPEFRAWFSQEDLAKMDADCGAFGEKIRKLLPVRQTLAESLLQSISRGRSKLRK